VLPSRSLPQITACLPEPPSSRDRSSSERPADHERPLAQIMVSIFGFDMYMHVHQLIVK
jgi:hypothetical protein